MLESRDVAGSRDAACSIVLVHGLWMTGAVFALQRARLARDGCKVLAFSYPSIRMPLDEIASALARFVAAHGLRQPHFVAHSLGGLVVLSMLARHPELSGGRVVLLGSPVAGSKAARQLARSAAGRALLGRAVLEWKPELAAVALAKCEVGMIAGTVPVGLGRILVRLPIPNDGCVCLDETRMPGLRDHVTLRLSHSAMMVSARAAAQIRHFLEHGHFAQG
jgi:pimeloyl-ACP methyl ester carboxylesterase